MLNRLKTTAETIRFWLRRLCPFTRRIDALEAELEIERSISRQLQISLENERDRNEKLQAENRKLKDTMGGWAHDLCRMHYACEEYRIVK